MHHKTFLPSDNHLPLLPDRGKPCHYKLFQRVMARSPQGFGTPLMNFAYQQNASIGGLDATPRCSRCARCAYRKASTRR